MKKLVTFASGGGSNFEALCESAEKGFFDGKFVLLVASKPGIGAIERAKKYGVPVYIESAEKSTAEEVKKYNPDLICLAGYMKKIPDEVLHICPVMNIHPALLPKFGGKGMYGHHVHEAVIAQKEKESGATVHFVDSSYDTGPMILQGKVEVSEGDTPQMLAAKVLKVEHKIYSEAVKLFCEDKLK
ncbi:formyltetrahydrofolate-dependent phosphoribosylglycinamide formyltransferase [Elusimicrobium posterum]|uniref:phosphoribosylglycinamide formyltransferase n=1 Tax=Elusimicrobium posterum TaxID=3116653 RepID=UPI003C72CA4A